MKLRSLLPHCAVSLGLLTASLAEDVKLELPANAEAQPAATTPAPTFTEAQLMEELGWFMAKRVGIPELGLTEEQISALVKGVATAAQGKDSPFEVDEIGPSMDAFMQRKQADYMAKLKKQSQDETVAYFAKLKENDKIVELPSGLRYEITAPGSGEKPKASDNVKVHYTGKLLNGTVFDSSVERGEPVEFKLDEVIPGWTEGLQHVAKGGKITLHIPSNLAYGDEGRPGIPPAATLVFDVELLDINPPQAAPAETPAEETPAAEMPDAPQQ